MFDQSEPGASHPFVAPARVNLVGEHTDYTGGLVLPMAIPFTTVATLAASPDERYHFTSQRFDTIRSMTARDRSGPAGDWSDYPVGVLRELQALGFTPPPFTLRLSGDIPLGAGLSSSASVEVATAIALLTHCGAMLSAAEIALLCQRAENVYASSPCGIMDQFAVAAAVRGHALLLNTRDLTTESLPLNQGPLAHTRIVIANSGVRHSIAGGDYGLRRRELEAGQAVLMARYAHVQYLGLATLAELEACKMEMSPESYRRCRHVVSENVRVLAARDAMFAGDPVWLGKVMTASHASQRDDFACSVPEIDYLAATATTLKGCHGARLTGGGFGGCTVNLVEATQVESFCAQLTAAYRQHFGLELTTYACDAVDGAVARANDAARHPQGGTILC